MENDIKALMEMYGKWTDDEWNWYLLRKDRFYRHFSSEQCHEFVRLAEETGRSLASKVKAEGEYSGEYLAKKYGLKIRLGQEEDFLMPGVVNFAQYHDGTIILSREYIEMMELYRPQTEQALGLFCVKDLMFYHEFFHYLEERDPALENAGIHIRIQPLLFLKRTISPESAGEIAAFAFAKEMTEICFHPCLLEKLWLNLHEKQKNI